MAKQTKNNVGAILLFVGLAGAGALAYYVQAGHEKVPPEDRSRPAVETPKPVEKPAEKPVEQAAGVSVLVPRMEGMELKFSAESRTPPDGVDPKVFALNEYLAQVPAVPKDAKVLGVDVRDGVAYIDCNQSLGETTYGTDDEKTVLDGIRATLGQYDDIQKVLLQVGGKTVDSLGNIDLTEPIDVIRLQKGTTSKPTEASPPPAQG